MAISITDLNHQERFKLAATAEWQPVDVQPVTEPNAVAFSAPAADLKPVLYIPVKRRSGTDTFPQLRIHIRLLEAALRRRNFDVPKLVGAEVKIDLANVFAPFAPNSFHLELPSGRIDSELKCDVTISAADVKKFLDPAGPMKARLNENLFGFVVEIPALQIEGKPIQGVSENRLYLYRKKSITFLPGVFGSQIQVDQGTGKRDAFPNFLDDESLARFVPDPVLNALLRLSLKQRIGVLECDQKGDPILPAFKPKLLRFGGFVYDTFTKLRAARNRRLSPVPDDFLVYDLRLFAYDWRGDLTAAASSMMERLRLLQDELRQKPDTDDQVAVAGHSTGGVIIRKMLSEPGAEDIISHAFFLNVPFRGAPKALSVFVTGCDPPGGNPMIPFVDPKSLRSIAPCAPIVYHLAPSFAFRTAVADIPGGIPAGAGESREREKAAFVKAAIDRDIYFLKHAVTSVPQSIEARALIASGADDWNKFVEDASAHHSGRAAYSSEGIKGSTAAARFRAFVPDEIGKRNLGFQRAQRSSVGWNDLLAERAFDFHKSSEAVAASGKWANKAFVFFSKHLEDGKPHTTIRVSIKSSGSKDCSDSIPALISPQSINNDWADGKAHAPEPEKKSDKSLFVEQWVDDGGRLSKRFWTFGAELGEGDGTVPLPSLLGFGGPAKVFQSLPGGPDHVSAPNSDWLWDRVMEVLEGFDVSTFLLPNADSKEGKES